MASKLKLSNKPKLTKMPKSLRIGLIVAAICVGLIPAGIIPTGDATGEEAAVPEEQIASVIRGNLTIEVTAAGNLSLSLTEGLAFEISGTVEEILVEEGDTVDEGQVLVKLDTSEWQDELTSLEYSILSAEVSLMNAQDNLDDAKEGTLTQMGTYTYYEVDAWRVKVAEMQVELAEMKLEEAESALEEALAASPEVIAPFDGFITQVYVSGGDEVKKGTEAVQLADPNKFEADILVSEMDIFDVELGGEAWVSVDALGGLSLPATVTHISPTATISSGVVNYEVKVEVGSLEEYLEEQREMMQQAMPDFSSGEFPEQVQQSINEGLITEEEAQEMMEQMQRAQESRQGDMALPYQDVELREGLTVTVSLVIDEATDVLLVPNTAVLQRGFETYVQVIKADGQIEERTITTGLSDWQYTEVTDGLSEGEEVVVLEGTSTTDTTSNTWNGPPGGGMMIRMGEGGPPQ